MAINLNGGTPTPTAQQEPTTAAEEIGGIKCQPLTALKGKALNLGNGGTFPNVCKDGDTFTVVEGKAAEFRDKAGQTHLYPAIVCKSASWTAVVSVKALVKQRVSKKGILTPQGDLADAIRQLPAQDAAEAVAQLCTAIGSQTLTLRVIEYVNAKDTAARLHEVYTDGRKAAPEDARLTIA